MSNDPHRNPTELDHDTDAALEEAISDFSCLVSELVGSWAENVHNSSRCARARKDVEMAYRIALMSASTGADRVRDLALEEAAVLCDSLGGDIDERNVDEVKLCANSLAWSIRRLKRSNGDDTHEDQEGN